MPEPGQMDRVLVTGAAGFIGSALLERLLARGSRVFAMTRSGALRRPLTGADDQLTVVRCDLTRRAEVEERLADIRPTVAFHLAWRGEPAEYLNSVPWNFESLRFGLSLLESLLDGGCERLVFAGSCAEYELGPDVLREDSPLRPSSVYGAAKLALGTAAVSAAGARGAALAWARIFYVYGPHEDPRRAVPALINASRDGTTVAAPSGQPRDFLHVDDVASALVAAEDARVHGPLNVCSGVPTSLSEIASIVDRRERPLRPESDAGSQPPPIVGDPATLRELGWNPSIDLESGLSSTVEWWAAT